MIINLLFLIILIIILTILFRKYTRKLLLLYYSPGGYGCNINSGFCIPQEEESRGNYN